MDFSDIVRAHVEKSADLTIATLPVPAREATSLGILQMNGENRITRFVEKPKDPAVLDSLQLDRAQYGPLGITNSEDLYLASMGIYVFNREVLFELLNNNLTRSTATGCFPTSFRGTGRTSGRSAASLRQIWIRRRTSQSSISSLRRCLRVPDSCPRRS